MGRQTKLLDKMVLAICIEIVSRYFLKEMKMFSYNN